MVESLDKVLRHPVQLDLDEVVRKREVLIVDGKMGTFGADNCRVMMQFILNALYGTLQRQQQLPEAERVRVALKVDEAHLILNESFADALATLRSGGLEVVAAWQYGEQIQDPKIRAGLMSLLRQRCMFSMGESEDAREMSQIAMSVYSDMIRDDPRVAGAAAADAGHDLQPAQPPRGLLVDQPRRARRRRSSRRRCRCETDEQVVAPSPGGAA